MTADAKFGLLLALVFIIAITFVINGLPGFLSKDKESVVETGKYVSHYRPTVGLQVAESAQTATAVDEGAVAEQTALRYRQALPRAEAVVAAADPGSEISVKNVVAIEKPQTPAVVVVSKEKPRFYTVKSGDSLAAIAKRFYGDDAGNKLANVEMIFEANRDHLEAADKIQVGQKLVIPSLNNSARALLKTGVFEDAGTVVSVRRKYIKYVVKENDSLWKIAEKYLGSGRRYRQILKMNKSVISDTNTLVVGTSLKIPVK